MAGGGGNSTACCFSFMLKEKILVSFSTVSLSCTWIFSISPFFFLMIQCGIYCSIPSASPPPFNREHGSNKSLWPDLGAGMGGLLRIPGHHWLRWGGWRSGCCGQQSRVQLSAWCWWYAPGCCAAQHRCLVLGERAEYTLSDLLMLLSGGKQLLWGQKDHASWRSAKGNAPSRPWWNKIHN